MEGQEGNVENLSTKNESKPSLSVLPKINSLANLRVLGLHSDSHPKLEELVCKPVIYRSSKPDRILSQDLDEFRKLGIKCIVDFRSFGEYKNTDGDCLLDKEYPIYKVKITSHRKGQAPNFNYEKVNSTNPQQNHNENKKQSPTTSSSVESDSTKDMRNRFEKSETSKLVENDSADDKKHFLINFFPFKFVLKLLLTLPWHMVFKAFFTMFLDIVRRNNFKSFIHFFIQNAVNSKGISGQYIDISEHAQEQICTGTCTTSNKSILLRVGCSGQK